MFDPAEKVDVERDQDKQFGLPPREMIWQVEVLKISAFTAIVAFCISFSIKELSDEGGIQSMIFALIGFILVWVIAFTPEIYFPHAPSPAAMALHNKAEAGSATN